MFIEKYPYKKNNIIKHGLLNITQHFHIRAA